MAGNMARPGRPLLKPTRLHDTPFQDRSDIRRDRSRGHFSTFACGFRARPNSRRWLVDRLSVHHRRRRAIRKGRGASVASFDHTARAIADLDAQTADRMIAGTPEGDKMIGLVNDANLTAGRKAPFLAIDDAANPASAAALNRSQNARMSSVSDDGLIPEARLTNPSRGSIPASDAEAKAVAAAAQSDRINSGPFRSNTDDAAAPYFKDANSTADYVIPGALLGEASLQRFGAEYVSDDAEVQKMLQETAPMLAAAALGSKLGRGATSLTSPKPASGSIAAVEAGVRRMGREGGSASWGVNGRMPVAARSASKPPGLPNGGKGATPAQLTQARAAHSQLHDGAKSHPGVQTDLSAFIAANPNAGSTTVLRVMREITRNRGFDGMSRHQLRRLYSSAKTAAEKSRVSPSR